ncbi:GDCCVxC domain-containing (seleno)protein [Enterovibrio norvegicus]|uniref:Uncharacterized protein n=2 Tax=Enterovibrio norvegicus TaxID=188144 RepID=A0A1I5Q7N0_9GAMM|nr:GDCCVxC domain-containing (seleno)protein [Enterovibrio norvegicus]TKF14289.1 hypothetical protein FCV66_11720 [Enterovibrio norvegicus]TKF32471.1 hypothetical protein FCV83_13180 [Enterovibrio norvegicus]SFP42137.1 hypothetical protein SAMN03084138_02149 [Enterovibrio norvegicus DSM 15893]
MKVILKSDVTCPNCGHTKTELMPIGESQQHYECENCHEVLLVTEGGCCVFCSYGSVCCPPVQVNGTCTKKLH